MKRTLALISLLMIIGVLLIPSGIASADQAFQTARNHFYSLNESLYPLKDGFAVSIHMNGPVNFEKKEFQLHGAKPDTEFFIFRVFQETLTLHLPGGDMIVPAGTPVYAGSSIWTDEQGNGHIITSLAPDNPTLVALKGTLSAHLKNVLSDGILVPAPGVVMPRTRAYETEFYESAFDWKWTP